MKLTKTDRIIMDSYAAMIDNLAVYLGSAYEISLHSLEDYNHSVVKIANGYHSGRTIGAPITDLAMNMLKRITDQGLPITDSYTSYYALNSAGERLKSSTIPVIGENERIIGLLCINLYLDTPLSEIIQSVTTDTSQHTKHEHFARSMTDTISTAVNEARIQVMSNPSIATVNKNKELIRILYNQGIFNMKDAVVEVADTLGLSRNTVYLHLRSISRQ